MVAAIGVILSLDSAGALLGFMELWLQSFEFAPKKYWISTFFIVSDHVTLEGEGTKMRKTAQNSTKHS